jgi:hypothetical protein
VCVVLHVAVFTGTSATRPVSPHTSSPRFTTLTHCSNKVQGAHHMAPTAALQHHLLAASSIIAALPSARPQVTPPRALFAPGARGLGPGLCLPHQAAAAPARLDATCDDGMAGAVCVVREASLPAPSLLQYPQSTALWVFWSFGAWGRSNRTPIRTACYCGGDAAASEARLRGCLPRLGR